MAKQPNLSEAKAFITEFIHSAEQLDVLLLLHSQSGRTFTAGEVSQQVYTVPASATLRLEELVAEGLLTSDRAPDPRYRYAPASQAVADRVEALAATYRADRVAVIRLIFQAPADPVRSFADAFRLKRPGA